MSESLRLLGEHANRCVLRIEALVILAITVAALKLFRLQAIRRVLTVFARRVSHIAGVMNPSKIAADVNWAHRRLGGSPTCLAVALTAEALLMQHGHTVELCLGAKRSNGSFQAHVWIEQDDVVIVGGPRELTLEYVRFSGSFVQS